MPHVADVAGGSLFEGSRKKITRRKRTDGVGTILLLVVSVHRHDHRHVIQSLLSNASVKI